VCIISIGEIVCCFMYPMKTQNKSQVGASRRFQRRQRGEMMATHNKSMHRGWMNYRIGKFQKDKTAARKRNRILRERDVEEL